MKTKKLTKSWLIISVMILTFTISLFANRTSHAKVIDNEAVPDQRWVISEIYLGRGDYKGAYLEIYNNDKHSALGWNDFVINLPFSVDLPPIMDLRTYKSHAYKTVALDDGWVGWLAKKYIQVMYGDHIFHEIQDALDEHDDYSYQRCQFVDSMGERVITDKFYYGKKTPGKAIECDDKSVTATNPNDLPKAGLCEKIRLNEIGANLAPEEQFIELINTGTETVNLGNCFVSTSRASDSKMYSVGNYDLEPGALYSFQPIDMDLKSINKTSGIVYVIDSDGEKVIDYKRYNNAKKDTALAINEDGVWRTTYKPTPGEDNEIVEHTICTDKQSWDADKQKCITKTTIKPTNSGKNNSNKDGNNSGKSGTTKSGPTKTYKPCREGYERNPETNRCRKVAKQDTAVDSDYEDDDTESSSSSNSSYTLKPCREGYERNPETNRCRKITSVTNTSDGLTPCKTGYIRNPETNRCIKQLATTASSLTPCREGYERNPETNRCRKVATAEQESELKPCKEGYERNPETNRCRKVNGNANEIGDKNSDDSAKYPVETSGSAEMPKQTSTMLYVIGGIIVLAIATLIWQYWPEIQKAIERKKAKSVTTATANTESEVSDNDKWIEELSKPNDDENIRN